MKYYVKFTLDYYYQNALVIAAYQFGCSYPFDTMGEASQYQSEVKERFMKHEPYAFLKCDESGLVTKHLQYGAWSAVLPCSDKKAREIEAHIKEEEEIY